MEDIPNDFALKCAELIPKDGTVLEIGSANGRDARFFAKDKNCKVIAIDFSLNGLNQLKEASVKDNTSDKVYPVVADAKELSVRRKESIDAVYARSALHLSDEELDYFFTHILGLLKKNGYIMIEGKTEDDSKIKRSEKITGNLYKDNDGHIRRAWNESLIRDIIKKYNLRLIEINQSTEFWKNVEDQFINFIAQK
ncbi:MAG: class I SAM-dependent methyltransferase [Candidatus Wolfebacteria bacterium]|nr:class I SAM-dependent methyltransferase [Candidatus Wolfebacteria bacterium]